MRIAIDIDSTLHPYWELFSRLAERRFGVSLPYEDQVTWEIERLRPEQVRCLVEESHCDEHVLAAEPYPHAVETISRWHADGHWIHITSHRADHCHDATARWLERIGLPCHDLYVSRDKIARCQELEIDLLIDDSPHNLLRAVDSGIRAATLLHPWNRELCDVEDVVAATDWRGLATRLEPLLAGTPVR